MSFLIMPLKAMSAMVKYSFTMFWMLSGFGRDNGGMMRFGNFSEKLKVKNCMTPQ